MSESVNAEKVEEVPVRPTSYIVNVNVPVEDLNNQIKLVIYSRSSVVKWLVAIDAIFLTLNFIIAIMSNNFFWLFFFLSPLCYCGWKGATEYSKSYLSGYLFYLGMMTLYYLLISFYYNSLFILLIFAIEAYLFGYTFRLYRYLKDAPQECLDSLREGWRPNEFTYYYY